MTMAFIDILCDVTAINFGLEKPVVVGNVETTKVYGTAAALCVMLFILT